MLEVTNLTVRYGPVRALHEVSVEVHEGELVALLGANGAGKTTLLISIAGAVRPQEGDIRFEGRSLVGLDPEEITRRGVALAPEGRRIFSGLTVEENLRLAGSWRRDRDQRRRDFGDVLERFPVLGERLKSRAGTLSGGQQQMLAIGRVLMAGPRLLLFDEPSLGLAPKLVEEVMALIADLREAGRGILLVEQNVAEALRVADRAFVLATGQIRGRGTPNEIERSRLIDMAYLGHEG
jgi:branched-chain amino acid transport system ATP-binding protein